MGISTKTHKMLWGRSGNRCALPTCRRVLVEDETETDDPSVVGDEAHIVAREENGPRGISQLTADERDKYDNLILMCKVHHKLIDDQPNNYTVDALHKMKHDHLDWIERNLSPDVDKQKDEEVYATYIDRTMELADFKNWTAWTSYLLGGGQPSISVNQFQKLRDLNQYLLSRVWPKRYDKLEFAFSNFRLVINDFIRVFDKYKQLLGEGEDAVYETEKIYKRVVGWNEEEYNRLSGIFDYHVDLVQDLTCEITRAANYLCDQIRRYVSASFRVQEGVLLIQTGPDLMMNWSTVRLEYQTPDQAIIRYPGLQRFMEIRVERGYHFGSGVIENYL